MPTFFYQTFLQIQLQSEEEAMTPIIFMYQVTFNKCSQSAAQHDVSLYIRLVPEHRAQRINVLISIKCFAHMFPNTHSRYHSMSARPEEAVSYRCQYPHWPFSLPPPLHTHGTGGLSPRTKEWGVSVENRHPNIPVTMERVAGRFN